MKTFFIVILSVIFFAGCASSASNKDPYPGSGGLYFGTPSDSDIKSGRSVFDLSKFVTFEIGSTTKSDVVNKLGKPAWWETKNSSSSLGYDYVRQESFMGMSKIERAEFTFDKNHILIKYEYPGSENRTENLNSKEYESIMDAYIDAAKSGNLKKLMDLTSPETRRQQGDSAIGMLHEKDTVPLFSGFKVTKQYPGKYTKDEVGNEGYIFIVLITNENGRSAPMYIVVLKENGKIYVSSYGLSQ